MSKDNKSSYEVMNLAYKLESLGKAIGEGMNHRPNLDNLGGLDINTGDIVMFAEMIVDLSKQQQKILDRPEALKDC